MKRVLVYGMTDMIGGVETYLMNYYRECVKNGLLQFDFVAETEHIVFENEIQMLGGRIVHVPKRHDHPIGNIKELRSYVKRHPEYETIYFCILSAAAVISVAAVLGLGRKIVVHSHNGSVPGMFRHKMFRPFLNILSDKKLACSEVAARFMFGDRVVDRGEVTYITNAIDTEKFCYKPDVRERIRKEHHCEDKIVFGFVGRLCYQKDPLRVIQFFEQYHKYNGNSVLFMIGEGEDRGICEQYVQDKGIQDKIVFIGNVQNVDEWMQLFDVFVLLSRYEGFPMVGVEAQCTGLPCIFSTNITSEMKLSDKVRFVSKDEVCNEWIQKQLERPRWQNEYLEYDIRECKNKLVDMIG